MRLRTRFVLALLAVLVVLSATSLVGFTLYRDAIVSQEHDALERTSQSVATQLDIVLEEKRGSVTLWSQDPALRAHGSYGQSASLGMFVSRTAFSGASVVVANGTMTGIRSDSLTLDEERDLTGRDFSHREYVRRALDGDIYVSDPVEAESGNLIVTVSAPIYEDGDVVAAFNAAFHLGSGDLGELIRASTTESEGLRIHANGSTVHSAGPTADDDPLVANATVGGTDWVVSAVKGRDAYESRLWTVTLLQGGAALFVLVSLAAFGGWLYREYVGNIERLRDGFASLVAGDYGATVDLSGPTEWEQVETHFNELSGTLVQRRSEVLVLNRVLRHNLRNAMTVVVGNADRIEARSDDDRTVAEARQIRERGEALLEQADHARAVEASLGDPAEDVEPRPVADVLDDVLTVIGDEFPEADVVVDGAPSDVSVGGGDLLVVAVDELVRNAVVHAEDDSPRVELTATADADHVAISVSDDGPGLPPVERRVLTEPFVETPTEHGRGLGVWLVTWLVQRIGGDIAVTVDDGTTVVVTVPRNADEE